MGKAQSSLLTVEPIGALFGALCIVLALPSRSAWHRSTAVSRQHVLIWSCCRYRGGEWVQLLEAYLALTTRTKTTKRKSRTWPPPRGRAGGREWSDWLLAAASSGWLLRSRADWWGQLHATGLLSAPPYPRALSPIRAVEYFPYLSACSRHSPEIIIFAVIDMHPHFNLQSAKLNHTKKITLDLVPL